MSLISLVQPNQQTYLQKRGAKGNPLSHNGSNGMWCSSVIVAPGLDRAYVVIVNSRNFGVTARICDEMMTSLIGIDLDTKGFTHQ